MGTVRSTTLPALGLAQEGAPIVSRSASANIPGCQCADSGHQWRFHLYAVMHPDDRDRVAHLLEQARENRSDYRADYRVTWPDGSLHWISAPGRVYGAANGDLIGMGGVTIDIIARTRAEAEQEQLQTQLVQAQKMESIGRLAGGVAHDFNNLLGVILGYTELALENANPAQPLHADLLEIQKAAQRSGDLTRQLLAFARKQTIAPQACDLNETVAGMLKMLRRLIGEPIELIWRPGFPLGPVKVDPAQIDQILANLCVNAQDAIAGVGQITIETGNATLDEADGARHAGFVPGEYVRLAVSDDDCGMDAETLAHLFEPFFTTKGVGRGTGLGLAADTPGEAIRLAEEHAGAIHLLVTDVVMPEMNGQDLARRLLSLYPDLKRLLNVRLPGQRHRPPRRAGRRGAFPPEASSRCRNWLPKSVRPWNKNRDREVRKTGSALPRGGPASAGTSAVATACSTSTALKGG